MKSYLVPPMAAGAYIRRSIVLLLVLLAAVPASGAAQPYPGDVPRGEAIKAAFLFHFLSFTRWPDDEEETPMTICVTGVESSRPVFEQLSSKQVGTRPVVVQWVDGNGPAEGCHVLYVGRESTAGASALLQETKRRSVLTVGDAESFTRQGGMIRFYEYRNGIRFEVNLGAVEAAELKISSRMLQLARIK